jgi:hypothetical protein
LARVQSWRKMYYSILAREQDPRKMSYSIMTLRVNSE